MLEKVSNSVNVILIYDFNLTYYGTYYEMYIISPYPELQKI
jgi:hypothetical protein